MLAFRALRRGSAGALAQLDFSQGGIDLCLFILLIRIAKWPNQNRLCYEFGNVATFCLFYAFDYTVHYCAVSNYSMTLLMPPRC